MTNCARTHVQIGRCRAEPNVEQNLAKQNEQQIGMLVFTKRVHVHTHTHRHRQTHTPATARLDARRSEEGACAFMELILSGGSAYACCPPRISEGEVKKSSNTLSRSTAIPVCAFRGRRNFSMVQN